MSDIPFNIISRADLDSWVKRVTFSAYLPTWIENLVRATAGRDLRELHFFTDEYAEKAGYDGTSRSEAPTAWYDAGSVCWELGKTTDVRQKAADEFDRVAEFLELENPGRSATVEFIFVTPRDFPNRRRKKNKDTGVLATPDRFEERTLNDWVEARRREKLYRNVRAVDAPQLIKWTNSYPDIALDVKRYFEPNFVRTDIQTPDAVIESYLDGFNKSEIDSGILTCGRDDLVREVRKAVAQRSGKLLSPTRIDLFANTIEEAVAFAATVHQSANNAGGDSEDTDNVENGQHGAESRLPSIILRTAGIVPGFANRSNTVFILQGEATGVASRLVQGNTVICCHALDGQTANEATALRDPGQRALGVYLEGVGINDGYKVASLAGGTLMSLRRMGQQHPIPYPPFIKGQGRELDAICIAALTGGWNDAAVHDGEKFVDSPDKVAIHAALGDAFGTGKLAYDDFTDYLRTHTDMGREHGVSDQLLRKIDAQYFIKAPVDALDQLSNHLTRKHIQFLEALLQRAFVNRTEEVAAHEAIFNRTPTISASLRQGLALTLCILAYRGTTTGQTVDSQPLADWAHKQVSTIIERIGFIDLVRQEGGLLSYFAEAAPWAFLDALEAEIQSDQDGVSALFIPEDRELSLTLSNDGVGLMFALSKLGWREEYFSDVVRLTVALHALDPAPDANMHPRPRDVFYKLFVGFSPQTSVGYTTRMAAVEEIPDKLDEATLDCLIATLPTGHMSVSTTSKPRFGPMPERTLTWGDVWGANDALFNAVLARLPNNLARLKDVVPHLNKARDEIFPKLLNGLRLLSASADRELQLGLWEALRQEIARHRRFPDSDWSMEDKRLFDLEAWRDTLKLTDEERLTWLFSSNWISDFSSDDDIRQEAVNRARAESAKACLETQGPDGLLKFAGTVKEPGLFGHAIAEGVGALSPLVSLVAKSEFFPDTPELFWRGLSISAYRRFETEWVSALFNDEMFPDCQDIVLLMATSLPLDEAVIDAVDGEGIPLSVTENFWSKVQLGFFSAENLTDDILAKLIDYGREAEILGSLHGRYKGVSDTQLSRLMRGAYDSFMAAPDDRRPRHALDQMFSLLKTLKEREAEPLVELAKFEYPLARRFRFHHDRYPFAIHALMTQDAEYFVSMLAMQYKTDPVHPSIEGQSKEAIEANASLAWHIMNTVEHPGLRGEEWIEASELKNWVENVRVEAKKYDLSDISDFQIGAILSQSDADPEDGLWPPQVVRNIIESHGSKRIFSGFSNRESNERGVYSNGVAHFGVLAEKFNLAAAQMRTWPKTRRLLRTMAKDALRDVEREKTRNAMSDAQTNL